MPPRLFPSLTVARRRPSNASAERVFHQCLATSLVVIALAPTSCGAPSPEGEAGAPSTIASLSQPAIYGNDDRLDVYEHPSSDLRERTRQAAVAFVYPHWLDLTDPDDVRVTAPTQAEIGRLCQSEPFLDQPAAAWCSGTLIDDDLVLTAGHCLGTSAAETRWTCQNATFLFNYYLEDEGRLATITESDVFSCRQIVSWNFTTDDLSALDYGIVQLDRPATPRHEPVPIALDSTSLESGDGLHVIGFGARLPAKLDSGAKVADLDTYANFFSANTDTFEGASGSGLYNSEFELVGVHSRGAPDWEEDESCIRSVYYSGEGFEEHLHAPRAIEALCDEGWPSARLCELAAVCGDGTCSGAENHDSCDSDCDAPVCGDGLCEVSERGACDSDCTSYADVPDEWHCPPQYYGDRDGCDCNCGALDVDCLDPDERVLGCGRSAQCIGSGECSDSLQTVVAANQPGEPRSSRAGCGLAGSSPSSPLGTHLMILLGLSALGLRRRRR